MGTDTTPSRTPRADAQPLAWKELTEEQQKCLGKIVNSLHGFTRQSLPTEGAGKRGKLLDLVRVDEHRWSNIYLIDGARGSGKTTILLVFLKACTCFFQSGSLEVEIQALEGAQVLRGMLLPTRILDLQPLPADTPLFTWIATRLLEVLDAAEEDAPTGRHASVTHAPGRWEPGHIEESEARRAWRKLVEVIAGGWENNLAQRKGTLDPEAWAIELERSEQERMTLQHCWRKAVELILAAAHDAHRHVIDKDVKLVIPIDDADMNPRRCVELLEVLRMLWHPRVVFLLTGHTDLFRTTLRVHYEGVFHRVGEGAKFATRTAADVAHTAAKLDRAVYEKVIPWAHRFELPPLAPRERHARIHEQLETVKLGVAPPHKDVTLATYLKIDEWLGHALPEYPRQLLEFGEEVEQKDAVEAALRLWSNTSDAEELTESDRKRVERLEHGLSVDLRGVDIPLREAREAVDQNAAFYSRRAPKLTSGEGKECSARTVATLLLCANIAGDLEDTSAITSADGRPYSIFAPTFAAGAVRDDRGGGLFTWPMPEWRTPADWETFAKVWQRALEELGASPRVDEAAQWFLRAVVAVGLAPRSALMPQVEPPRGDASWPHTFEALERCAAGGVETTRGGALQRWAMFYAPLLCAPESGLSADRANDLLHRWGTMWRKFNVQAYDYVRLTREMRARAVWPRPNEDIAGRLRDLDSRHGAHVWSTTVLGPEDRRIQEVRAWLSALEMPVQGDSVAAVADDLNLIRALVTDDRDDAGRLDAAMKVDRAESTPKTLATIWRAMVTYRSWGGPHSDERVRLVVAQGDRLQVNQGRNAATHLNQQRSATLQGDLASTRSAALNAPSRGYRSELFQYAIGTLPQSLSQAVTFCSRAMLVLCREVAAALNDEVSDDMELSLVDFKWIRRSATLLGEVCVRAPAWPMLRDEACLLRMWLEATDSIWSNLNGNIDRDQFEAAVGAFIECVLALHERNPLTPKMTVESGEAYWRVLAGRVDSLAREPRPTSRRALAVWHWSRVAVPLLTAPEGALCATTGRWFLAGIDDASVDMPAMHAFRREYLLRFVGTPGDKTDPVERARTLLQQIANVEPDNPWIERFGETEVSPSASA